MSPTVDRATVASRKTAETAAGYGLLSLVFVLTFTIPVYTVGLWRLWTVTRAEEPAGTQPAASTSEPA